MNRAIDWFTRNGVAANLLLLIIAVSAVHAVRVSVGGQFQDITTVAKVALIVAFIGVGILVGPVGTGVDVAGITRIRDAFLDARYRTVTAELARHDTAYQLAGRVESVLGEPDNGLTAQLGALWDAFEDLALDPADGAARQAVVSQLSAFAARTQAVATGLDQLGSDVTAEQQAAAQQGPSRDCPGPRHLRPRGIEAASQ